MRRGSVAVACMVHGCWWAAALPAHADDVTFSRDVAPIIYARCAGCHHPGDAAPFSLLSYDDVRRRSRQIVEVTGTRFMPPWLPAPAEGGGEEFEGTRRLSDAEIALIKSWVEAGSPQGDPAGAPPIPTFVEGWKLGTPDLVLESPAYELAADGRDVFRNFVVPVELESPRWVRSVELRPENPRVTHHARLGVDGSNESVRRDAEDPEPGYAGMAWGQDPDGQLVIWAPGMSAGTGSAPGDGVESVAWRMFPKTSLVLHAHMQPSGKPEIVRFRIGIRFADQPPSLRPVMMRVGSCDIDIPPGEAHHVVTDGYTLPIAVDVHTVFPHAHSLCRELKLIAALPDGSSRPLIVIKRFDENWHDLYRFREPVRLPSGTRLVTTFVYDNTDENPRNRSRPARRVVFGSNATDEMADVYVQVTAANGDQRAVLMESYRKYDLASQAAGYRKSLEVDASNHWSQEALAACYVGLGEPGKAAAILSERVQNGPREVFPVVSYGMALLATGDAPGAEAEFRRAISMDGEYALAWLGLGRALAAKGGASVGEAESAYRRAMELGPGMLEARMNLADALVRRGELGDAAALCRAGLGDAPDPASLYVKLGEISARQRKREESLEYYTQARRAAPYTHPPKVLLGLTCISMSDTQDGVRLLEEARVESPEHPIPPLILGQMASRQQRPRAAIELLNAAAALPVPENWPESHRQRFLVLLHTERLNAARRAGDDDTARDAAAAWLKADPANPEARKAAEESKR